MSRSFAFSHRISALSRPSSLLLSLALAVFLCSAAAHAQFGSSESGTQVHDTSPLKPPPGVRVAIVEFADFECPDCARANPLVKEATEKYHIPWVRHDFPLPYHAWSFKAAVNARWFDIEKGKTLGDEYRNQIFANQSSIFGLDGLRRFTDSFAQSHGIALPFVIDPQGKLTAEVKDDYALGQHVGIAHTPTIWIVTDHSKGPPFVEVLDRSRLYQMIDQAVADTTQASKPAAKAPVKKHTAK